MLAPTFDLLRRQGRSGLLARATLPRSKVDWEGMVADYDRIRDGIAGVFPAFADYNTRVRVPGGFHLGNAAAEAPSYTYDAWILAGVPLDLYEDPCATGPKMSPILD